MIGCLLAHLESLSADFRPKEGKVVACIAGGAAMQYHTGIRTSDDVDISWSHRILLPVDRQSFMTKDPEGTPSLISVVPGASNSTGFLHPRWKDADRGSGLPPRPRVPFRH